MAIFDHFSPTDVVVVRSPGTDDEERVSTKAVVVGDMATFEVSERVYDGDVVETADPRGGVLRRTVRKVEIFQSPFGDDLDHIEAHF